MPAPRVRAGGPRRDRNPAAIAVLAAAGLTLPFLGKASTLDEETHLFVASWLRQAPARPFDWVRAFQPFHDPGPGDYFLHPHPPLWHYFLAAWGTVAGEGAAGRLLGPLLLALAAVAVAGLARRAGAHPRAAALLFVTSPVAVLAAHDSFMLDIPLLAFVASASWAAAEAGARRSLPLAALSGTLAAAGGLVKYTGLLAFPGLIALLLATAAGPVTGGRAPPDRPDPRDRGRDPAPPSPARRAPVAALALAAAAPALLFTAAFQLWTFVAHGRLHLPYVFAEARLIATSPPTFRVAATLAALGGVAFAPGLGAWLGLRRGGVDRVVAVVAAIALGTAALAWTGVARGGGALRGAPPYSAIEIVAVVALASAGAAALLGALRSSRDGVGAALALLGIGVVAGQVAGLGFASARYLAPALPALAVLLTRLPPGRAFPAALSLQAALALGLGIADAQLVGGYPRLAAEVDATFPEPPGRTRWVCAEWGLRDALVRRGFRPVPPRGRRGSAATPSPDPRPGDLMVRARVAPADPACDAFVTEPEGSVALRSSFPLRLMDRDRHAGYYGDWWGLLPFSLATGELERVTVHRVTRAPPWQGPGADALPASGR
ncbi:glycosyltransferase family 39 protein [Myxococcota bacterium]|nr:glycosyltransferase family 39 protein [Myxococcota bacterium]